jgi:hypothetical protein
VFNVPSPVDLKGFLSLVYNEANSRGTVGDKQNDTTVVALMTKGKDEKKGATYSTSKHFDNVLR